MSETYLNGKITVTSLAVPTQEDLDKLRALSPEERRALIREAVEQGEQSGVSNATMQDIWEEALKRAKKAAQKADHAP